MFIFKNAKPLVYLIVFLSIILYSILDEEPFFDITDLNTTQIIVLAVTSISLLNENLVKFFFGQGLLTDRTLFIFAYYYANNLYIYFLLIWCIFYCHKIAPLNMSNVDFNSYVVNNLNKSTNNFNKIMFCIVFHIYIITSNLNKILNQKQILMVLWLTFLVVYNLVYSVSEVMSTSLTSSEKSDFRGSQYNSKYSLTYNFKDASSGFEWHLAESKVQSIALSNSMSLFGSIFAITYVLIYLYIIVAFLINQTFNKLDHNLLSMQILFMKEIYKNVLIYALYTYFFMFVYTIVTYIFLINNI